LTHHPKVTSFSRNLQSFLPQVPQFTDSVDTQIWLVWHSPKIHLRVQLARAGDCRGEVWVYLFTHQVQPPSPGFLQREKMLESFNSNTKKASPNSSLTLQKECIYLLSGCL
jgi:hypothetical protein